MSSCTQSNMRLRLLHFICRSQIQTCFSFPGRVIQTTATTCRPLATQTATGQVTKGQTLGMIRSTTGCLDNTRQAMKVLGKTGLLTVPSANRSILITVNALGLRDEIRRSNRDQYITVSSDLVISLLAKNH